MSKETTTKEATLINRASFATMGGLFNQQAKESAVPFRGKS